MILIGALANLGLTNAGRSKSTMYRQWYYRALCKTIGQLRNQIWAYEFSRNLSLNEFRTYNLYFLMSLGVAMYAAFLEVHDK